MYFKNGLLNDNRIRLIKKLVDFFVHKNNGLSSKFTDDLYIEMYEEVVEINDVNE